MRHRAGNARMRGDEVGLPGHWRRVFTGVRTGRAGGQCRVARDQCAGGWRISAPSSEAPHPCAPGENAGACAVFAFWRAIAARIPAFPGWCSRWPCRHRGRRAWHTSIDVIPAGRCVRMRVGRERRLHSWITPSAAASKRHRLTGSFARRAARKGVSSRQGPTQVHGPFAR